MTIQTVDGEMEHGADDTTRAPSLKERQRQEREQLILKATAELLVEKGYHEMSVEEIASRVGTSKGTIYLHFASKGDLVVAMLDNGMRLFSQTMEDSLGGDGTPTEKIKRMFERVYLSIDSEGYRVARIAFENAEIHSRLAERRHTLAILLEQPRQRLAEVLEAGKASGEFDPEMPTSIMLTLLSSLVNPMSSQRLLAEEQRSVQDIIHYVSNFFFKGVRPEGAQDA